MIKIIWSESEIELLKELNKKGLTPIQIKSYFPNRTHKAIQKKMNLLKLYVKQIDNPLEEIDSCGINVLDRVKYENKHLKRVNFDLQNRLLDEDRFIERTKEVMATIKKPSRYKILNSKEEHTPQELVILFSDCQVGEKITFKETQLGEYNIQIFEERVKNYYEHTMRIVDRYRKTTPINKAHVFMLGDIVEGEKIFRGQGSRITDDVIVQFFEAKSIISMYLSELSANFDEIFVDCVAGNHGREGKKDERKFYVNWDYLMYRYMEDTLNHHDNIKWNIPMSWWTITEVLGHKFYLTHGDDLIRYMGIPWYAMERMDNRTSKMLSLVDEDYDHLVIGHHHQALMWDGGPGERIVNGSFSSANYYAAKKLHLMTKPKQLIFGVHPKRGITFRYSINVGEK